MILEFRVRNIWLTVLRKPQQPLLSLLFEYYQDAEELKGKSAVGGATYTWDVNQSVHLHLL